MRKLGLMLVLVLLVAACGDDEGEDTTATGAPAPESVTVGLDDFLFEPSTLTVTADAQVSLTAINSGGSEHTWTLLTEGDDVVTAVGLDPARVIVSVEADEGASATGTFTSPAPGIYQVICTITGHLELGMEGTLIVEG